MTFNTRAYNCPLCNKNDHKLLLNKQDLAIVRCRECDFVYVDPRVANEELSGIYQHNYFKNKAYGYIGYEQEKRLRVKNFERWLTDAAAYMPAEKNVYALDIGCAAGYCLDVMSQKGWHAEGLELDEEMYKKLKDAGYAVFNTTLENFESRQHYSLITLFDVIEHITGLDAAFKKLHALLDDDGIVVMVTPDHNSLQRKLFKKRWFQYKPIEHIQYFTKTSIGAFAERNGLQMIFHTKCGQYADTDFILNRLQYYRFAFLEKMFRGLFKISGLKNKFFYTDTGSLFVVLKKRK